MPTYIVVNIYKCSVEMRTIFNLLGTFMEYKIYSLEQHESDEKILKQSKSDG